MQFEPCAFDEAFRSHTRSFLAAVEDYVGHCRRELERLPPLALALVDRGEWAARQQLAVVLPRVPEVEAGPPSPILQASPRTFPGPIPPEVVLALLVAARQGGLPRGTELHP